MNKLKRTTEEVSQYFKENECELLDEYKGVMIKMKYRCKCGRLSAISWNNFTKGKRCGCGSKYRNRYDTENPKPCKVYDKHKLKRTTEEVSQYFKENECELLDEYKGAVIKMKYRCKCGRLSAISWNNFSRGKRCGCGSKYRNRYDTENPKPCKVYDKHKLKRTTEEVSQYFKENECELLDEYKGVMIKMKYRCKCGRLSAISWNNFSRGKRCGCDKHVKFYKPEEIENIFAKYGFNIKLEKYDPSIPIQYRCKCGDPLSKTYRQFMQNGKHCDKCAHEISGQKRRNPDREIIKLKSKFRKKCYKALQSTLDATGKNKVGHTTDMLDYGPKELQNYITQHPNWDRVKNTNWHLDHIFPIDAFLEHNILDIKLINSLDNLQPITQKENNSKHAKYNEAKFTRWLETKNVKLQKLA